MTNNDIVFVESSTKNGIKNNLKYIRCNRECSVCEDDRRIRICGIGYVCFTCNEKLPKGETLAHINSTENLRNKKIRKKMVNNSIPVVYNGYNTKTK